jgi:hypothetical protein
MLAELWTIVYSISEKLHNEQARVLFFLFFFSPTFLYIAAMCFDWMGELEERNIQSE